MTVIPEIEAQRPWLEHVRRDIHAHPELAYQELRTSQIVCDHLMEWGIEVDTGLAKTGVVGTLRNGDGPRIALRADMDALPINEENDFAYKSTTAGKMHACGHDGHTTMLLGAARHLAATRNFAGTVHFIFQPAEEAAGGAKVMMDDGLFDRFPVEAVFGMHNWPGLDVGRFAVRTGAMMASLDCFDVVVRGVGTHGAQPHRGIDPIVVAAQMIAALQSIVSRNVDPLQTAIVSVTKISGGNTYNIIPGSVAFGGGIRCYDPALRSALRRRVIEVVEGVAAAFQAQADIEFVMEFPPVMNDAGKTAIAADAAVSLVGAANVDTNSKPSLGSEDFAYMLEKVPGCYLFIGNGAAEGGCGIHNPGYDFNDDILTLGASYWVRLAERYFGAASSTVR